MTESLPEQGHGQAVKPERNPFSRQPDVESPEECQPEVDNSETAMDRLRRPFDVGPPASANP
jgi:hypothetical protein